MSMWKLGAIELGAFMHLLVSLLPNVDVTASALVGGFGMLPVQAYEGVIGTIAIFSIFVDIHVLLACVSFVLGWRLLWLGIRLWRILLEVIPGLR